jgi:hypothetical protein
MALFNKAVRRLVQFIRKMEEGEELQKLPDVFKAQDVNMQPLKVLNSFLQFSTDSFLLHLNLFFLSFFYNQTRNNHISIGVDLTRRRDRRCRTQRKEIVGREAKESP